MSEESKHLEFDENDFVLGFDEDRSTYRNAVKKYHEYYKCERCPEILLSIIHPDLETTLSVKTVEPKNYTGTTKWSDIDWISLTDQELLQVYLTTEGLNLGTGVRDTIESGVDAGALCGIFALTTYGFSVTGACSAVAGTAGTSVCAAPLAAGAAIISWPLALGTVAVAGAVTSNMVRKNYYMCWLKTSGISATKRIFGRNQLERYRGTRRQTLRNISSKGEEEKFINWVSPTSSSSNGSGESKEGASSSGWFGSWFGRGGGWRTTPINCELDDYKNQPIYIDTIDDMTSLDRILNKKDYKHIVEGNYFIRKDRQGVEKVYQVKNSKPKLVGYCMSKKESSSSSSSSAEAAESKNVPNARAVRLANWNRKREAAEEESPEEESPEEESPEEESPEDEAEQFPKSFGLKQRKNSTASRSGESKSRPRASARDAAPAPVVQRQFRPIIDIISQLEGVDGKDILNPMWDMITNFPQLKTQIRKYMRMSGSGQQLSQQAGEKAVFKVLQSLLLSKLKDYRSKIKKYKKYLDKIVKKYLKKY